jgi:hypothetical protein
MIDLNQPEIIALQQPIRELLNVLSQTDDDYDDDDRSTLVRLFVKYLNALKIPVSTLRLARANLKVLNNAEFCTWEDNDNAVTLKNVIIVNDHPEASQTDTQIDVYIWLDGIMQATAYNEDLGGMFDPCNGRPVMDVLENPGIIIDQIRMTIFDLIIAFDDEYDDDSEFEEC